MTLFLLYHEMPKKRRDELANDVIDLRKKYSLTLKDENTKNMQTKDWKSFVKSAVYRESLVEPQSIIRLVISHMNIFKLLIVTLGLYETHLK